MLDYPRSDQYPGQAMIPEIQIIDLLGFIEGYEDDEISAEECLVYIKSELVTLVERIYKVETEDLRHMTAKDVRQFWELRKPKY